MHVSICVCTYNRGYILRYCLESLTKLSIPAGCEAEILVVDNNSTDDTREVVACYSKRSSIPIFYFHEPEQGSSAARNRAINESYGDYIGFLDDECVVSPNWLEIVFEDIQEFAPYIIGGPYIGALLPATGPKWFKAEYGNAYFLNYGLGRGFQNEFRASAGNMLIHKTVFQTQRFDRKLGMKGNEMKFGEESFLQERFLSKNPGAAAFYEPRIEVTHYILPHKMSLSYFAKREMEMGACHYCTFKIQSLPIEIARACAYLCIAPFVAVFRDRRAFPFWQNYLYEQVIPRLSVFGAALERVRRRYI
ncbi:MULTISPECIES: glycosyltransferase family 2 protein [unclassified Bradyrhizobium]